MQTPPSHFELELAALKDNLLTMAASARRAVETGIRALVERDNNLAREVRDSDNIIDALELEIDEQAINLLAKAPLASDLRLIAVAMKTNHDLERVGDEATTIARRTLELNKEPPFKPFVDVPQLTNLAVGVLDEAIEADEEAAPLAGRALGLDAPPPARPYVDLPHMAQLALSMLQEAIEAFLEHDPAKARAVIPRDKELDALNKQLHRELAGYMAENPASIGRALNLMVISKSLERVGDHAKNVAEEVVFLFEGRDIRHPTAQAARPN